MAKKPEKKSPVHTIQFYSGGSYVEAAIWENTVGEGEGERTAYAVTFQRTYRNGDGWQNTKAMRAQDLPHLMEAARQAYLWVQEKHTEE